MCWSIMSDWLYWTSIDSIPAALVAAGRPTYLDDCERAVIDSFNSLIMCAKHWILTARIVGTIANEVENPNWAELAYYTFRLACLANDWDYKEILNYAKTANIIGEKDL